MMTYRHTHGYTYPMLRLTDMVARRRGRGKVIGLGLDKIMLKNDFYQ